MKQNICYEKPAFIRKIEPIHESSFFSFKILHGLTDTVCINKMFLVLKKFFMSEGPAVTGKARRAAGPGQGLAGQADQARPGPGRPGQGLGHATVFLCWLFIN